ncbi:hypothetical protein CTM97_00615 [Photobacterium phosphoreum]|uniref:Phage tail fibre protein N-terminal domain-containing protein n=1 Tax=Photobacterium phosphoreum TaxID=659 RepID=A0A2T3JKV2_PHOPO|nr:phage tail protein [Photobacterium phosphoreum]PSU24481.1 hypothetical protein CTM96_12615 [Photobacterium phosphoreum]PSU44401.1 hypothetical protein CTM97_00615 [Photobacterium phosphoreum]PSU49647.1 hypothetical protein C9J18_15635 [Photobacterium phosphoreum]
MSKTILTAAFATYQAQCSAAGHPIILDEFVFALIPHQDPNAPIHPEETLPTNEMIKGRFKITQKGMINPDAVVYSIILGTEIGSWDFNWIGLVNSDTNLVAAITHTVPQTKVKADPANNIEGDTLTRNIITSYVNAAKLTDINVTADVWQLDFNQRLMAMDDRVRRENTDSYGISSFIDDAWSVEVLNNGLVVNPGTGYVNGLRCVNEKRTPLDISSLSLPVTVYLEASFEGTINSEWQTHTHILIANNHPAERIDEGIRYYSCPIALIKTISDIKDLRILDWRSTHLNEKNDPHSQYIKKSDIDTYAPLTSTDKAGLIELATQKEVNTGIDNQKAVTPATLKPVIDSTKNYASEQAKQEANRVKSEIYGGIPTSTLDTIKEVADALTETGDAVATLFKQLGEKLPTTVFDTFKKTVTDSLNNKLGKTEKAADSSRLNGYGAAAYLCDNGWNSSPGQDANTQPSMSADFTYANNAPIQGSLIRMGAKAYDIQLNAGYGGTAGLMQMRTRNGDNNTWSQWFHIYTEAYKQTATLSGTIWHGGTIPVPAGFSRSQCHYIVSLNDSGTGAWDVDEGGTYPQYRTRCSVNQSTGAVTALRDVVFDGRGNVETGCMANYMVIATR